MLKYGKYYLAGILAVLLVVCAAILPERLMQRQDPLDRTIELDRPAVTVTSAYYADLERRLCLLANYYGENAGQSVLATYGDVTDNWDTLVAQCDTALALLEQNKVLPKPILELWKRNDYAVTGMVLWLYDNALGQWCSFVEISGSADPVPLTIVLDPASGCIVRLVAWNNWMTDENNLEIDDSEKSGWRLQNYAAYLGTAEFEGAWNTDYLSQRIAYAEEVENRAVFLNVLLPENDRVLCLFEEYNNDFFCLTPLAWADLSG